MSAFVSVLPDGRLEITCPCCSGTFRTAEPLALVVRSGADDTVRQIHSDIVTGIKRLRWTPLEDDIVRRLYRHGGWKQVAEVLPRHRTRQAIIQRAQKLGEHNRALWQVWTQNELDILRRVYPHGGAREAARLTGHSLNGCWVMASKLGIRSRRKPGPRPGIKHARTA